MKKLLLLLLLLAVVGGGVYWLKHRPAEEKPKAAEEKAEEKTHVKRDEKGNAVVVLTDEIQGNMGLLVAQPTGATMPPEVVGYGHILDPAPLSALLNELKLAQAAHSASSNELERLKVLAPQGNASQRALQAAQATALHDQFSVQAVRDRLVLGWGSSITESDELDQMMRDVAAQTAALVRIDLPAGEPAPVNPTGVRLTPLRGDLLQGKYLGVAASTDPQTLGAGYLFLARVNPGQLRPGEAVVGHIQLPGDPSTGVIVPTSAVVRTEGAGWVYLMNKGSDSFTRVAVTLDHLTQAGWFLTKPLTTNSYIVVTGAQTLLSEELKSTLKAD